MTTSAPPKLIRAQIILATPQDNNNSDVDNNYDNNSDDDTFWDEVYNPKLPFFLKRSDIHPTNSVSIYYIRPTCRTVTNPNLCVLNNDSACVLNNDSAMVESVPTVETELGQALTHQQQQGTEDGVCVELLAVNNHKVRNGSVRQAEDMIIYYMEKYGKVSTRY